MPDEIEVGTMASLKVGSVTEAGPYAVGNSQGDLFAVSRRCRHLRADLAKGSIDEDGCLVCPWHHARYDVTTGRMVAGPQGIFAKIPFLETGFKLFTSVLPLRRGKVTKRNKKVYVE